MAESLQFAGRPAPVTKLFFAGPQGHVRDSPFPETFGLTAKQILRDGGAPEKNFRAARLRSCFQGWAVPDKNFEVGWPRSFSRGSPSLNKYSEPTGPNFFRHAPDFFCQSVRQFQGTDFPHMILGAVQPSFCHLTHPKL